jgi:hypothetical protein
VTAAGLSTRRPALAAAHARWYRAHGKTALAEALEGELVTAGRCRRCGRTLTDPDSLAKGIGPDCAGRVAQ